MTETTPSIAEYLEASDATYLRTLPALPTGLTLLVQSDQSELSDGFYAEAFIDSDNQVIIAYEGTVSPISPGPSGLSYAIGTVRADLTLKDGGVPNALNDAASFVSTVEFAAKADGISINNIFVTGHSLGGAEAEAAAVANAGLGGGDTFGAPGISAAFLGSGIIFGAPPPSFIGIGSATNLTDFVDFGDPVGNFSSETTPGNLYAPSNIVHVGHAQMVGVPSDAAPLTAEARKYFALETILTDPIWSEFTFRIAPGANIPLLAALVSDLATTFGTGLPLHALTNYASDLGYSLSNDGIAVRTSPSVVVGTAPQPGISLLTSLAPLSTISDVISNTGQLEQLSVTNSDQTSNVVTFNSDGSLVVDKSFDASGQLVDMVQINPDNTVSATFYNTSGGSLNSEVFSFSSSSRPSVTLVFANGSRATFDSGTVLQPDYDPTTDLFTATLTSSQGADLGTLALNTTTGAGTVTLNDGTVLKIAGGHNVHLTDLEIPPEQILVGYLNDLGIAANAASLDQTNEEFSDPALGVSFGSTTETASNGDTITFDEGTGSGSFGPFGSTVFFGGLTATNGDFLGSLQFNAATGTGSLTLADGTVIGLTGIPANAHLTNPGAGVSALQTLEHDLSDLGNPTSVGQLDAIRFDQFHPAGPAFTINGEIVKTSDTTANVFYFVNGSHAIVAGQPTAPITDFRLQQDANGNLVEVPFIFDAQATNFLEAGGDISNDDISGINELDVEFDITLTAAQFNDDFPFISGSGAITASTGGTFDLSGGNVDQSANFRSLTATAFTGTTLIGNDIDGQTLVASPLGNDLLIAGNGAGDVLIGGAGVDALIGGDGGDTFELSRLPSDGSSIVGRGGNNALQVGGDITGIAVTGMQTLETFDITLTAQQFGEFSAIKNTGLDRPGQITAVGPGIYSLASVSSDPFNMTAIDFGGTTLVGDDADGETLTASLFGNDTLIAGNGAADVLNAGDGIDALVGGTGGDSFIAIDGLAAGSTVQGADTNNLLITNGDISDVEVTGIQALEVGATPGSPLPSVEPIGFALPPADITLTADQFNEFTTITGSGSIIAATGGTYDLGAVSSDFFNMTAASDEGTTLVGDAAGAETLTASAAGNDVLIAGSGPGVVLDASVSSGNDVLSAENATPVNGFPSVDQLDAAASSGNDTLIAGPGSGYVLAVTASTGASILDATRSDGGDQLDATNSTGNNTLTAGTGTGYSLFASGSDGDNILDASNSSGLDRLDVSGSTGNNTLTAGSGSDYVLGARGSSGNNILDASGSSGGDNFDIVGSSGDNVLTTGSGNNYSLDASETYGNNILDASRSDSGFGGNPFEFITLLDAFESAGDNTLIAGSGPGNFYGLGLLDSSGNNTIIAGTGSDFYLNAEGTTGDNTLNASNAAGNDILDAANSTGNNVLIAGDASNELLTVGESNPLAHIFVGQTFGDNRLSAGNGSNDTLDASFSLGDNILTAGNGDNDTLDASFSSGNNQLGAGDGDNDILDARGGTGANTLSVGNGNNDTLYAGTGNDTLVAGAGTDTLYAGTGLDDLQGGSGTTTFVLNGSPNPDVPAPNSSIVGGSDANILEVGNPTGDNGPADVSQISIAGVPTLVADEVTLTSNQLANFATIKSLDEGLPGIIRAASSIFAATGGTYSLVGVDTPDITSLVATSADGTTLIGNDSFLEALVASPSGNDTLIGGNGQDNGLAAGGGNDTLIAGSGDNDFLSTGNGVSTLIGGRGNDFFSIEAATGIGTVIEGVSDDNTLQVGEAIPLGGALGLNPTIDITGVSITGVQTLIAGNVTLTADQLASFESIESADDSFAFLDELSSTPFITAATPGTYSLAGKGTDLIDLAAPASGDVTLIGNDADGEILRDGGSGNDTLIAGNGIGDILGAKLSSGNVTMVGGTGGDTFNAGAGNDVMVANGGNNTFVFDNANSSSTYIIDNFHTDDGLSSIEFGPNIDPSSIVLTRSGNNLVITFGTDPIIVENYFSASQDQISSIVFNDGTVWTPQTIDSILQTSHEIPFDFNGDGISDLVFQQEGFNAGANAGTPQIWLWNGTAVTSQVTFPNPAASWHIITSRDLNGDAMSDLIWQNSDGTPGIWLMNGTTPIAEAGLTNPGPSWQLVASGDTDGDGNADLIWQNTDGTLGVWLMNGTTPIAEAGLTNPGSNWKVVGAADFNRDGRDDILLQNSATGDLMIDLMNGTTVASSVSMTVGDPSWHAVSTGEFNGQAEIAWQSTDGTVGIWLMNGTTPAAEAALSNPGAGWELISVDHFTPNGQPDLLFQNTNGAMMLWEMNGTSVAATLKLPNPGAGWQSENGHPFTSSLAGASPGSAQPTNSSPLLSALDQTLPTPTTPAVSSPLIATSA